MVPCAWSLPNSNILYHLSFLCSLGSHHSAFFLSVEHTKSISLQVLWTFYSFCLTLLLQSLACVHFLIIQASYPIRKSLPCPSHSILFVLFMALTTIYINFVYPLLIFCVSATWNVNSKMSGHFVLLFEALVSRMVAWKGHEQRDFFLENGVCSHGLHAFWEMIPGKEECHWYEWLFSCGHCRGPFKTRDHGDGHLLCNYGE